MRRCKPWLLLLVVAAGCGGGGNDASTQTVVGPAFTFAAPAGWEVELRGRSSSASPEPGATDLVSVRVFRLARPYRPSLWPGVERELDRVAADLARRLGGRIESRAVVVLDGRRAKRYDIRYEREGVEVVERTAFVLRGRQEFQLVCRFEASDDDDGRRACATLFATFRLE